MKIRSQYFLHFGNYKRKTQEFRLNKKETESLSYHKTKADMVL